MDFHGAFSLINEKEEDKHIIWELIMSFESLMDITKKVSSLGSLIAFNVINNLFGVKTVF